MTEIQKSVIELIDNDKKKQINFFNDPVFEKYKPTFENLWDTLNINEEYTQCIMNHIIMAELYAAELMKKTPPRPKLRIENITKALHMHPIKVGFRKDDIKKTLERINEDDDKLKLLINDPFVHAFCYWEMLPDNETRALRFSQVYTMVLDNPIHIVSTQQNISNIHVLFARMMASINNDKKTLIRNVMHFINYMCFSNELVGSPDIDIDILPSLEDLKIINSFFLNKFIGYALDPSSKFTFQCDDMLINQNTTTSTILQNIKDACIKFYNALYVSSNLKQVNDLSVRIQSKTIDNMIMNNDIDACMNLVMHLIPDSDFYISREKKQYSQYILIETFKVKNKILCHILIMIAMMIMHWCKVRKFKNFNVYQQDEKGAKTKLTDFPNIPKENLSPTKISFGQVLKEGNFSHFTSIAAFAGFAPKLSEVNVNGEVIDKIKEGYIRYNYINEGYKSIETNRLDVNDYLLRNSRGFQYYTAFDLWKESGATHYAMRYSKEIDYMHVWATLIMVTNIANFVNTTDESEERFNMFSHLEPVFSKLFQGPDLITRKSVPGSLGNELYGISTIGF